MTVLDHAVQTNPYGQEFYDRGKGKLPIFAHFLDYMNRKNMSKILSRVSTSHGTLARDSALCDYGCGAGAFVDLAKSEGFDILGFEQSAFILRQRRDVLPVDKFFSSDIRFDVVFLSHVLEHVEDPVRLLQSISSKLRNSGLVYIEVPNFGSREQTILGCHNLHIDPTNHIHHFSINSLELTIQKAGLELLDHGGQRFKFPMVSIRSIISKAQGKTLNALIDMISILWFKLVKKDSPCIWVVARKS